MAEHHVLVVGQPYVPFGRFAFRQQLEILLAAIAGGFGYVDADAVAHARLVVGRHQIAVYRHPAHVVALRAVELDGDEIPLLPPVVRLPDRAVDMVLISVSVWITEALAVVGLISRNAPICV